MVLLDDVKRELRISSTAFDGEVLDLIESAKMDLIQSGINVTKTTTVEVDQTPKPTEEVPEPEQVLVDVEVMDALIKRAIIFYCKANFGYDNPDAQRFYDSYRMLETHLALSGDYNAT